MVGKVQFSLEIEDVPMLETGDRPIPNAHELTHMLGNAAQAVVGGGRSGVFYQDETGHVIGSWRLFDDQDDAVLGSREEMGARFNKYAKLTRRANAGDVAAAQELNEMQVDKPVSLRSVHDAKSGDATDPDSTKVEENTNG